MNKPKQKKYFRLNKADRISIEQGLNKKISARQIARNLDRAPASITDEVKRNRTVCKGPGKGERVSEVPNDACAKLLSWPYVCNGCSAHKSRCCSRRWKCEYSATRAQVLADDLLCEARKGVNAKEYDFECAMARIRSDIARGLSPAQIACGRACEFRVSASTIYRWIEAGYAGMSNAELRRKVGYKKRKSHKEPRQTSHGQDRSWAAFCDLEDNARDRVCEMDTVIGKTSDTQCILTLYLRACKLQLCLLLPEKTSSAVAAALDSLETSLGKELFEHLFGLILTDNGTEFADCNRLEKSVFPGKTTRTKVYYCDVRQSQQKGGCERNHVELRKLLPKRRGIRFDMLEPFDMAIVMSQLNSEPRPSLMGLSPFAMLKAANPSVFATLCTALGIEEIAYEKLELTIKAINKSREERGLSPLI